MRNPASGRGARTVRPSARPLGGRVAVPGDKSIAHRALILGTLAEGDLRVRNLPESRDVLSTRRCLEALGAEIRDDRGRASGEEPSVLVRGLGLLGLKAPVRELDCGNSGTTMRLLMGVLAGQPFEVVLAGDASLSRRPMKRVTEPLTQMGASFDLSGLGHAPVRLTGKRPLAALSYRLPVASAQVKSALLLAGLYAEGETRVEDPYGTRDHTERMLLFLSSDGTPAVSREGTTARVRSVALRSGKALTVPGDPSSAAFFAAAAAIVPGSSVTLRRVLLNPSRLGFFDVLRRMGAAVRVKDGGSSGREPVGDIVVDHAPLKATSVPASLIPTLIDEVPLLAVLAALADGETRIEGLGELRLKESDRLEGTAAGLRALGAEARAEADTLIVRGPARLKGGEVQTRGDHRLAMAFAVAALAAEGETALSDGDCAAVSYPGFFEELGRLAG
ncbi:MAG: 3-phosphoshikimate 1-carboxyvinyltransferase [Elusimicrobiota bacterium]